VKNYISLRMFRNFGSLAYAKCVSSKYYVSLTPRGLSKTGHDKLRQNVVCFDFTESPWDKHVNYAVTHEELV
jgi:hypothetical protein